MPTIARPFIAVLAIAAAITTTKGTVEIVYPPYLAGYGYTLSLIGFLTALIAGLQLVSRLPVGAAYRADTVRRQFAVALVVFAISTSGFAFAAGQPPLVAGLSVVHGFAFGSLGTLGLALAIDVSGGRRAGVSMAWYTAANSTGYATGSLVGGTLADTIGIPATLGLIGVLPVLAAVAVMALPPIEAAPFPSDRGRGIRGLLAAGLRLDSRVWLAFGVVLYLNVLMDSVDTFFPVFAPTIGISLATVGVLRAIKSGSAIFIRSTGMVLLRAVDYHRVTLIAVVAAAVAAAALPLTSSVAVLVPIFVVSGLARGVLRATSAATIAELRNEGRDVGLASGIYNSGLDIGTIVGPALGGVISSAFGIGPMFQIIAALSLLAWLAVAISSPTTRAAAGLAKRHTIGPPA
ncbi:MAG TPA: MFS transporter [Candidatus Limnocylindria bacterium]|nr:MFS transporter [Candidatus Limnocylindria bacterium]